MRVPGNASPPCVVRYNRESSLYTRNTEHHAYSTPCKSMAGRTRISGDSHSFHTGHINQSNLIIHVDHFLLTWDGNQIMVILWYQYHAWFYLPGMKSVNIRLWYGQGECNCCQLCEACIVCIPIQWWSWGSTKKRRVFGRIIEGRGKLGNM